jgi:hypothetical protein
VFETATDQRVVRDVELEPVDVTHARDERHELVRGHVEHAPAVGTHDVGVRRRQMKERGAVTVMEMLDQSPRLERLQRAVDGRHVYLGMRPVDVGRDVLRGQMLAGLPQQFDDRASRRCDPSAFGPQHRERVHRVDAGRILLAVANVHPAPYSSSTASAVDAARSQMRDVRI